MTEARDAGTITVTGTGRVAVEPDVADLRLGVSVSRETVAEARSEAARVMAAILGSIRGVGVAERDIRTTTLSIQPRHDYREGKPPTLVGYDLANVVEVTVRDLATLGDVVDGALTAGATSLDGLSFRLDDPIGPEARARTAAVVAARGRAEVLAKAAGVRMTGVGDIVEGSPPATYPRAKTERMLMAADAGTPVSSGTTEIAVTVTVTFRTA